MLGFLENFYRSTISLQTLKANTDETVEKNGKTFCCKFVLKLNLATIN
jgi:hypothetical protein